MFSLHTLKSFILSLKVFFNWNSLHLLGSLFLNIFYCLLVWNIYGFIVFSKARIKTHVEKKSIYIYIFGLSMYQRHFSRYSLYAEMWNFWAFLWLRGQGGIFKIERILAKSQRCDGSPRPRCPGQGPHHGGHSVFTEWLHSDILSDTQS